VIAVREGKGREGIGLPTSSVAGHFAAFAAEQKYSGVILAARAEEILFLQAYGMASFEHGVPNRPDTKFYTASLTKPVTAMAALILLEQGKLELHQPARRYLPELGWIDERITVHQLLTHTSGIPDFETLPGFAEQYQMVLYQGLRILELIRDLPPDFEPGTGWRYSNTGYNLLGLIIERLAGISYEQFVREHIFGPLGMSDTDFGDDRSVIQGLASGYSREEQTGRLVKAAYFRIENFRASGHMVSTAEDLLKWSRSLDSEEILREETLRLMFTPHASVSPQRSYGYGWSIYEGSRGHDGWLPGYWCRFRQYPRERITVILLGNHDHTKESGVLSPAVFL